MKQVSLKPCPFCSSRQIGLDKTKDNILNLVVCKNCNSRVSGATKESAIKKWNTRKSMDNIVAELEELKTKYNKLREVCEDKFDAYELECKCIQISKDIDIVKRGGVE